MKQRKLLLIFLLLITILSFLILFPKNNSPVPQNHEQFFPSPSLTSTPTPTPISLPTSKVIPNGTQVFQTFNNCGPASLSMTLSYFGMMVSQEQLGQDLRPFQVPLGINDDKSVSLDEMSREAEKFGFLTYHRPNGTISLLKQFTARNIPVITRTWLHVNEDIGHYRVVKGYDGLKQTIIQDDSFEGKNLEFSYADFLSMWEKFDNEYLALIPKEKKQIAEEILGKNLDEKEAWQEARNTNLNALSQNPSDIYSRFNLSIAYYHLGQFQESVNEYEKVALLLPFRTLWYQIEPIESYYELGQYDKVFPLTDSILNGNNRAFSELYILRGKIYEKQGNIALAKSEFEKAVYYNTNLPEAQDALASVQ